MKHIEKDELYQHLSGFLTKKGIEFKDGSYTQRIQQGCSILADLVNMGQEGLEKAKTTADQNVERLRQIIHEKTAPKTPQTSPDPEPASTPAAEPAPKAKPTPKAASKTRAKAATAKSKKKS